MWVCVWVCVSVGVCVCVGVCDAVVVIFLAQAIQEIVYVFLWFVGRCRGRQLALEYRKTLLRFFPNSREEMASLHYTIETTMARGASRCEDRLAVKCRRRFQTHILDVFVNWSDKPQTLHLFVPGFYTSTLATLFLWIGVVSLFLVEAAYVMDFIILVSYTPPHGTGPEPDFVVDFFVNEASFVQDFWFCIAISYFVRILVVSPVANWLVHVVMRGYCSHERVETDLHRHTQLDTVDEFLQYMAKHHKGSLSRKATPEYFLRQIKGIVETPGVTHAESNLKNFVVYNRIRHEAFIDQRTGKAKPLASVLPFAAKHRAHVSRVIVVAFHWLLGRLSNVFVLCV